jgi:hypothetical protein
LIISSITGGQFLVNSDTFAQAQSPQSNTDGQIAAALDVADSTYNANTRQFLGMTEEHYSEQGFLKGVGNVTNNQTFINTHLSDELTQGKGNGTLETQDGQKITWISSDIGRSVDGRWVFYGIILFNNTQGGSLSMLDNRVGLYRNTAPLIEPDHIWLLK